MLKTEKYSICRCIWIPVALLGVCVCVCVCVCCSVCCGVLQFAHLYRWFEEKKGANHREKKGSRYAAAPGHLRHPRQGTARLARVDLQCYAGVLQCVLQCVLQYVAMCRGGSRVPCWCAAVCVAMCCGVRQYALQHVLQCLFCSVLRWISNAMHVCCSACVAVCLQCVAVCGVLHACQRGRCRCVYISFSHLMHSTF